METNNINVLMVDDHKMTLVGYSSALEGINRTSNIYQFTVTHSTTIDAALRELNEWFNYRLLHLVFLDIQLPKDSNNQYQSGEDLGIVIRKKFPQTKIIIITTFDNNLLIQNLLESINPEGLIIKSDLVPENFMDAVLDVLEDPPYYSKTVIKFLRKQHGFNYHLDRLDRLIIYYISAGKQTKDLPNYVPLSLPGIERRKKRLKEIFEVEDGNDIHLITRAREEGFL
ncbi:response regulator [Aequorivita viscosa]|uniref:DNA-binding response regulator, NarL/FixJ family, contains REC and HTH domains n=1 Tax=Aequorivita viscosa TaxID=797419 RepID=A0A1M6LL43_9FLAO|nr:response regulator transcription factor [Aequorivita viscosa]SDV99369.1 DNA-binding response regulator, NarL/FixJ family, contains REC and HTH domains [Aequorivita viscosa]SHJ71919.1 DNA-binding response regulator, NarL/FixJ family, contains REC and HTH domains [Aequorivita viscosa]